MSDGSTYSGRLPFRRRLGYGIGDLGFNLYFSTASLYLLLYYTDVLGLDPATGGWIFAAALIWDAISDPLMGGIANRTRSRWGRYRPYLLFGSVPLAAAWALNFLPTGFTGTALVLYVLAVQMLFRTCYTIVSMPFLSLSAVMTSDSNERGVLASFRMVAALGGGLIIAYTTLPLVNWLGDGDQMRGFFYVALLFSTIATILFAIVFASTREEVADEAEEAIPSFPAMLRMFRTNSAFWLVGGLMLMIAMATTFFNKTIPYFFKYDIGREDLIGTALATVTGMALVSIPFWTFVMRKTSKRRVAMLGPAIMALAYTFFWLAPDGQTGLQLASLALLGFGTGAGYLTFWAMIPDTVEFGEWRAGVRAEGMIMGVVSFVQKAALGLGVGLLGEALSWIGYVANQPQTPGTLEKLETMMFVAPLGFAIGAGLLISLYPIGPAKHARLVRALKWRHQAQARKLRPPAPATPL